MSGSGRRGRARVKKDGWGGMQSLVPQQFFSQRESFQAHTRGQNSNESWHLD